MEKGLTWAFLFALILVPSVLAQNSGPIGPPTPPSDIVTSIQNAGSAVYEAIKPVLEAIIGEASNGETFLAKVLFLIIIFAIYFKAAEKLPIVSESQFTLWIVTIATSILSIRWFGNSEIVKTAILPYSVVGIAISAGIPFFLYFVITKDLAKTYRKIGWIFFAVIFTGLWFTRLDELGNVGYVYLVTAILALFMLKLDGTLQRILKNIELEKKMSYPKLLRKHSLEDQIKEAFDAYARAAADEGPDSASAKTAKKRYKNLVDAYNRLVK